MPRRRQAEPGGVSDPGPDTRKGRGRGRPAKPRPGGAPGRDADLDRQQLTAGPGLQDAPQEVPDCDPHEARDGCSTARPISSIGPDLPAALDGSVYTPQANGQANGQLGAPPARPRPLLGYEIEPQPESWIWQPYLPRGEVTLLAGASGHGKSTLWAAIAAAHTGGPTLPGWAAGKPGWLFILGSEENYAKRVLPRLAVAGVQLRRVVCLEHRLGGARRKFVLPADQEEIIEELMGDESPLLVADPLARLLPKGVSRNDGDAMRAVVMSLAEIAHVSNGAALAMVHPRKGASGHISERIAGSQEIYNAADAVNWLVRKPGHSWRHDLAACKTRGAFDGLSVSFETALRDGRPIISAWHASALDADQVAEGHGPPEQAEEFDRAVRLVKAMLEEKPRRYRQIREAADASGVSEHYLKRAKAALRVPDWQAWEEGKNVGYWGKPDGGWPL